MTAKAWAELVITHLIDNSLLLGKLVPMRTPYETIDGSCPGT
jgi:hypothetical protein